MAYLVEKSSVSSKRMQWRPELGLRGILAESQLFMWEKLPCCPRGGQAPTAMIAKANQLLPLTQHDQRTLDQLKKIGKEDRHRARNLTSRACVIARAADFNFFAPDGQQALQDAADVDRNVIHQMMVKARVKAMDASIWSALPEDIIEKVLARLPLSSVLRFRAVCQRWNSVLLSGSFLSSHSKSSLNRQPCFVLCTIGQFACTFDPSLGRWLTLLKPTSPGASVVASTGSLFCLGNQVTECRVLSVCNPITRSLRHLPAMRRLCLIHKITMFEDQGTNAYTIVVAGEDNLPTPNRHDFNLITEVYNSNSNEWRAAKDPPSEATFGSDPGVWFEGSFYCLTEFPSGMVKFCAEEGMWEEVRVVMPRSLAVPALVTVKSRLLMVAKYGTSSQGKETAIKIWELVQSSKETTNKGGGEYIDQDVVTSKEYTEVCYEYEWVEVLEMPSVIRSEFMAPLAGAYAPFVCAGVGSCVLITTHMNPQVLVLDMGMHGANACSHWSWSWLPRDPLFPKRRDFHLLGFSFEPSFGTSP